MKLSEFFAIVGGDYDEVLSRLPTESMVKKFLRKFLDDSSYDLLKKALDEKDLDTAFRAAHTMKGIGVTLGLGHFTADSMALTEALRNAVSMPPEQLVEAVDRSYAATIAQIKLLEP